jgi:methylmalonyl-CoA mutase cobalamin-binding subunit
MARGKIVGAALSSCVHVAGIAHVLELARERGWEAVFLGPAVPVPDVVQAIRKHEPDVVALSYRLTSGSAAAVLAELKRALEAAGEPRRRYAFGGTPAVCEVARRLGLFEAVFDGTEGQEAVVAWLEGAGAPVPGHEWADMLLGRVEQLRPYPLLRHHFGQPTVEATVDGARRIAEAAVLDVLSLGPDQNAQESFFRPEEMAPGESGAGGVPVRSSDDLRRIYAASRCGNYPLLRCYSGTRDLIRWAEVLLETIHQAWAAVPLFWYSTIDGRSNRPLVEAIRENQATMAWYTARGVPVEVNDAHHWSLREAPDGVAVAAAFLAAYSAKRMGARTYVAQYMLNTPPRTSAAMDLAKMLAKRDLIWSLHDGSFSSLCQVRAGLTHFGPEPNRAKGQLAASTAVGLALEPDIVHVVGFSEGDHAATADEVIEACEIAHGVLADLRSGRPDVTSDPLVEERRAELREEARLILDEIRRLAGPSEAEPLASPETLAEAVRVGVLDAPHLRPSTECRGAVKTRIVKGACVAWDDEAGRPLPEAERLAHLRAAASGAGRTRTYRRTEDRP